MRIEDHLLVDDSRLVDLTHRPAPNRRFALNPRTICIHYDVCHSLEMNTAAQFASKLYYHVAVEGLDHDRKLAEVRQYTPFDKQGSHAKGFNDRAIGLVIVNPGPLIRCSDGKLRTTYYEQAFRKGNLNAPTWDENDAIEARHPHPGAPKNWTHWAAYHYEERDAVLEICKALVETYPTITKICGHDHLSPGNKFDPGPAGEDAIVAYIRGEFPALEVPGYPEADDDKPGLSIEELEL